MSKIKCTCGTCKTCLTRERTRRWREKNAKPKPVVLKWVNAPIPEGSIGHYFVNWTADGEVTHSYLRGGRCIANTDLVLRHCHIPIPPIPAE